MNKRIAIIFFCILLIIFLLSSCKFEEAKTESNINSSPSINYSLTQTKTNGIPTFLPSLTPEPAQESVLVQNPGMLASLGKGLLPQIVYSHDGKTIYVNDGFTLQILDSTTYEEINIVEISDRLTSFARTIEGLSYDDQIIAINSSFSYELLNTETFEPIAYGMGEVEGVNTSPHNPIFTRDNNYVISYFRPEKWSGGDVCRLDVHNNKEGFNFCYPYITSEEPGHEHLFSTPAISHDNQVLAAAYSDENQNILYIWEIESGKILHEIHTIPDQIISLSFSKDDSLLLGQSNTKILLWDGNNGSLIRSISGFANNLTSARFSKDEKKIIISFDRAESVLYEMDTDQIYPYDELEDIIPQYLPYEITLLQEGYLASNNKSESYLQSKELFNNEYRVEFSPDGKTIAIGAGNIQIWDSATFALLHTFYTDHDFYLADMVFDENGNYLAAVTIHGDVMIWDLSSEKIVFSLAGCNRINWHSEYGNKITDLTTQSYLQNQSVLFSPEGDLIYLTNGPIIEAWDWHSAEKIISFDSINSNSIPTKFSIANDGGVLYALINNQYVSIWDRSNGKLIRSLGIIYEVDESNAASDLQGSLMARSIPTENKEENVLEAFTIEQYSIINFPQLSYNLQYLKISPDGSLLAGRGYFGEIFISNLNTQEQKYISTGDGQSEYDFAISSDNSILALITEWGIKDVKLSLWDLNALLEK